MKILQSLALFAIIFSIIGWLADNEIVFASATITAFVLIFLEVFIPKFVKLKLIQLYHRYEAYIGGALVWALVIIIICAMLGIGK